MYYIDVRINRPDLSIELTVISYAMDTYVTAIEPNVE